MKPFIGPLVYSILSVVTALPGAGAAEPTAPADKSGYSLAHPTPAAQLRELSTDRPDQTESPYTVDAGHFQIEMDFAKFTYDRDPSGGSDVRTRDWSVAPVNLKVGLLNSVDLQLMIDPYVSSTVEDRATGLRTKASGFGDVTTRLKINFWGNDAGKTALAVMPFVKWPLSASEVRNGKTEGGVIVPFGVDLGAGWGLCAMTEVDFVSDGAGGYDTEFINSVTLARDFTERVGGYVEFFTVTSRAPGYQWQGQLDLGVTVALGANAQLDFGCNFGVTKSAPDLEPFVGFSRRY
jgi:hypothetical protein